jgi:hypothetical protein
LQARGERFDEAPPPHDLQLGVEAAAAQLADGKIQRVGPRVRKTYDKLTH